MASSALEFQKVTPCPLEEKGGSYILVTKKLFLSYFFIAVVNRSLDEKKKFLGSSGPALHGKGKGPREREMVGETKRG